MQALLPAVAEESIHGGAGGIQPIGPRLAMTEENGMAGPKALLPPTGGQAGRLDIRKPLEASLLCLLERIQQAARDPVGALVGVPLHDHQVQDWGHPRIPPDVSSSASGSRSSRRMCPGPSPTASGGRALIRASISLEHSSPVSVRSATGVSLMPAGRVKRAVSRGPVRRRPLGSTLCRPDPRRTGSLGREHRL